MKVNDWKSLTNFADTGQGTLRVPDVKNPHELKETIILPPTAQPLVASRRDDLSKLIAGINLLFGDQGGNKINNGEMCSPRS